MEKPAFPQQITEAAKRSAKGDNPDSTHSIAPEESGHVSGELWRKLLEIAACPECDGSGAVQVQTRQREYVTHEMAIDAGDRALEGSLYQDDEFEVRECQFCSERRALLGSEVPTPAASTPDVSKEKAVASNASEELWEVKIEDDEWRIVTNGRILEIEGLPVFPDQLQAIADQHNASINRLAKKEQNLG